MFGINFKRSKKEPDAAGVTFPATVQEITAGSYYGNKTARVEVRLVFEAPWDDFEKIKKIVGVQELPERVEVSHYPPSIQITIKNWSEGL